MFASMCVQRDSPIEGKGAHDYNCLEAVCLNRPDLVMPASYRYSICFKITFEFLKATQEALRTFEKST